MAQSREEERGGLRGKRKKKRKGDKKAGETAGVRGEKKRRRGAKWETRDNLVTGSERQNGKRVLGCIIDPQWSQQTGKLACC